MEEQENRANSNFSSTYTEEDNTRSYIRGIKFDKPGARNLWNELMAERKDYDQYRLVAYTNDTQCRYSIQFANNIMVPVYLHTMLGMPLYTFKDIDVTEPVVVMIESLTINDAMQLRDLAEYYKNTPLQISSDPKENIIASKDILDLISTDSFPVIVRVMHIVKLNNHKHERRVYLPALNVTLYKSGKDLRYAGEHPKSRDNVASFKVNPKNSREDRNLYQSYFKIINNEEPGRKYYIRMFNKVLEIESTPSMSATENSCIKLAYYQEQRKIDEIIKEGIDDINLKEFGIYKTRSEAESIYDINKLIEKSKIDLELNKISLQSTDSIFKSVAMRASIDNSTKRMKLDGKKLDFELEKLTLDKSKLALDKEKLELEFNKLLKEIKLIERGYKNEIGKLTIGIIKEITDSVIATIKLASLIKSLFH